MEGSAGAVNAEGLAIYCADIGSIKNDNFGWAVVHGDRQRGGKEIGELVDDVVVSLAAGIKVALEFGFPLWVPVPDDPSGLTDARVVDGNESWPARSGGGTDGGRVDATQDPPGPERQGTAAANHVFRLAGIHRGRQGHLPLGGRS